MITTLLLLHTNMAAMTSHANQELESLSKNGREVLILGDININFLKYKEDNQTSEYLDIGSWSYANNYKTDQNNRSHLHTH